MNPTHQRVVRSFAFVDGPDPSVMGVQALVTRCEASRVLSPAVCPTCGSDNLVFTSNDKYAGCMDCDWSGEAP